MVLEENEEIKWSEKVTNEFLEHIVEKRTLLSNILSKHVSWIGHILSRISLCDDAIE